MRIKILAAVLASASLFAANAHAQTEIQWWHSMTGALGDKLNELANGFNASGICDTANCFGNVLLAQRRMPRPWVSLCRPACSTSRRVRSR